VVAVEALSRRSRVPWVIVTSAAVFLDMLVHRVAMFSFAALQSVRLYLVLSCCSYGSRPFWYHTLFSIHALTSYSILVICVWCAPAVITAVDARAGKLGVILKGTEGRVSTVLWLNTAAEPLSAEAEVRYPLCGCLPHCDCVVLIYTTVCIASLDRMLVTVFSMGDRESITTVDQPFFYFIPA
jgi:hypothetical protein